MKAVAVAMYWAQVHLTAPCVTRSLPDHQSASCKCICECVLLVPVLSWCGHAACNGPYEPGLQREQQSVKPCALQPDQLSRAYACALQRLPQYGHLVICESCDLQQRQHYNTSKPLTALLCPAHRTVPDCTAAQRPGEHARHGTWPQRAASQTSLLLCARVAALSWRAMQIAATFHAGDFKLIGNFHTLVQRLPN